MQPLDIISVNLWQILISLANLVILFLILKKFLYGPVTKMLDKRREEIDTQYSDAESAKENAQKKEAELTMRLDGAKTEAEAIVKEAADTAHSRGDKIIEDANKEAEQIVANMQPKPLWNRTAWEGMMTNLGLPMQDEPYYNEEALYVTMQMICSDDAETLMSYLGMQDLNNGNRETLFKLVYKLALNKLCDKDKMFNIREYFKL